MPRMLIFGKQGAGKGTQAERLAAHYGIPHISTGDMFRAAKASGSKLGRELARYMDEGELVPDELVIRTVCERLDQPDAVDGFLLDGFPRTRRQAEQLDEALGDVRPIDVVVNLDVPTDEVVRRMEKRRVCEGCGAVFQVTTGADLAECDRCGGRVVQRDDDQPEAIQRRLALYEEQTAPLLAFYSERGLLLTVDGTGAPEAVFARIVDEVDQRRDAVPA